jgi:hypothetical protein
MSNQKHNQNIFINKSTILENIFKTQLLSMYLFREILSVKCILVRYWKLK